VGGGSIPTTWITERAPPLKSTEEVELSGKCPDVALQNPRAFCHLEKVTKGGGDCLPSSNASHRRIHTPTIPRSPLPCAWISKWYDSSPVAWDTPRTQVPQHVTVNLSSAETSKDAHNVGRARNRAVQVQETRRVPDGGKRDSSTPSRQVSVTASTRRRAAEGIGYQGGQGGMLPNDVDRGRDGQGTSSTWEKGASGQTRCRLLGPQPGDENIAWLFPARNRRAFAIEDQSGSPSLGPPAKGYSAGGGRKEERRKADNIRLVCLS
jgi:hypothetical protein